MHRLLSTILVCVLSIVTYTANAEDKLWTKFEVSGIQYQITSISPRTCEVIRDGKTYTGAITIPSSVTYNYSSYTVTSLGSNAFYNQSITSISIPSTVSNIGDWTFNWCSSLTSIDLPNSVKTLGQGAFSYSNISSIKLGSGLQTIGIDAFYGCSKLTSITIPASVTSIEDGAFSGCSSISSINVAYNNNKYCSVDGVLYDKNLTTLVRYPILRNGDNYEIPNTVTSIKNYAFQGCKNISQITIQAETPPSACSSVFENFETNNCTLKVPLNSLEAYKEATVWKDFPNIIGCASGKCGTNATWELQDNGTLHIDGSGTLTVYNNVKDIPWYPYRSQICKVEISSGITSLGELAFWTCPLLAEINVDSNNNSYSSENGILFNKDKTAIYQYPIGKQEQNYTIPNTVMAIAQNAFRNCGLKSITIPAKLSRIQEGAFDGCLNLNAVHISSIYQWCNIRFDSYNANPLAKAHTLYLKDEIVKDLIIPNSVTSIGDYAFCGCYNIESLIIGNSVTSIGDFAFYECYNLTNVEIPDNVTIIGNSAFEECDELVTAIIGNSVTSIGEDAFSYCSKLTTVTIGNSVKKIGEEAFESCKSLSEITVLATNPPSWFDSSSFEYVDKQRCMIFVPSGSVSYYKNNQYWNLFKNIKAIPTVIELEDNLATFDNLNKQINVQLTYTRNFPSTQWQSLYIPFAMQYSDWSEDFEIARLNDVHQFDDDEDGEIDRTVLESVKLKAGSSIEPNTPYMIKAKEAGEKTITLTDATLYAAEENSFDVTSWYTKFTFTGTYNTVTDMATRGHYAMADGGLKQASSDAVTLGAFRWYLDITDRNGNPAPLRTKKLLLSFDDGEITAMDVVNSNSPENGSVYSISGVKVGNDTNVLPKGLYIKNGNKVLVK